MQQHASGLRTVGNAPIRRDTDHTTGAGSIFLLRSGTPCVLLDLDGTLNIGDEMMVEQTTLDAVPTLARRFDAVPQKGVLSVCRTWAARGYQCVYLSGRQARRAPGVVCCVGTCR